MTVMQNNKLFEACFAYSSTTAVLSVADALDMQTGVVKAVVKCQDQHNTQYQTNVFDVEVVENHPPTVVSSIKKQIFYYGNFNNTISLADDLFADDETIIVTSNE
mmetsp:Transcript_29494/g.33792  ORF Transcript_29494/g.33792 Transcript_29494/m.33792 type:complete len:105 (-) Transcript_29494:136-450(-)